MEKYAELSCLEYQTNSAESFYSHGILGFISRRRVNRIIGKLSGLEHKLVLDVGCEAGYIAFRLAEAGFRVSSFDVCRDAVSDFKRTLGSNPKPNIDAPLVADVYNIPFVDSAFDAIVCSEVIPLIPSLKEFFGEFARVVKKDGLVVITYGNQKNRRRVYPILRALGFNVEAVEKTFPYAHQIEDITSSAGNSFVLEEVDMFPSRHLSFNTIVVLRKKGQVI